MVAKEEIYKKIINGRLLKKNGSWMYCSNCNNTVGYLCYTTYQYFKFDFICNCGNNGCFELGEKTVSNLKTDICLLVNKNRLCCPNDQAPLFSVVEKNLKQCSYEVICNKCNSFYIKE